MNLFVCRCTCAFRISIDRKSLFFHLSVTSVYYSMSYFPLYIASMFSLPTVPSANEPNYSFIVYPPTPSVKEKVLQHSSMLLCVISFSMICNAGNSMHIIIICKWESIVFYTVNSEKIWSWWVLEGYIHIDSSYSCLLKVYECKPIKGGLQRDVYMSGFGHRHCNFMCFSWLVLQSLHLTDKLVQTVP